MLNEHEVKLRALIVTGATAADGVREVAWPLDQLSVLPPDSEWSAAALVPTIAPIFAAPAPFVPPASERSGEAKRQGGLYLLGYLDRCMDLDGVRHCMRWAQVIGRDNDRFTPGYLPAYQVAPLDAWVRAPGDLPRGQLIPAVIEGDRASFLLLVRLPDNVLHTQMLDLPTHEGGFPYPRLEVTTHEAVLRLEGAPPLRVELSPDMDRRALPSAG